MSFVAVVIKIFTCTFNQKMPDTRSGKSKADEDEQISELI